jgi:putative transposase
MRDEPPCALYEIAFKTTPFFEYPADIRKAIYTTNAIESLNMTLRKVIKNKRIFPSDNSVFKVLFLAIENVSKK